MNTGVRRGPTIEQRDLGKELELCQAKIDDLRENTSQKCSSVKCPKRATAKKSLGLCTDTICTLDQFEEWKKRYETYNKSGIWRGISGQGELTEMTKEDRDELAEHVGKYCHRQYSQIKDLYITKLEHSTKKQNMWKTRLLVGVIVVIILGVITGLVVLVIWFFTKKNKQNKTVLSRIH